MSIKSYNIYRKPFELGNSAWSKIATVNYVDSTEYTDETANPLRNLFNYRISANDHCENEVGFGKIHTPIKLSLELVENYGVRLIWSKYEGFEVGEYRIYKGTKITNLVRIDILRGSLNEYLDLCVPNENVFYRIEAIKNSALYSPDNLKSTNTVQVRSNIVSQNMQLTELAREKGENLIVYPNPARDYAVVVFSDSFNRTCELSLFDLNGKIVLSNVLNSGETVINCKNLNNGMYMIRLRGEKTSWGKLIVNH